MIRAALFLAIAAMSLLSHAADVQLVRSVTVIPASEPTEYGITLRSSVQFLIPLVATGTHLDGRQKTKSFTDAMTLRGPAYGAYLTERVIEGLRASGYQVAVQNDIKRPAGDPDSIDHEKLAFESDIALQIRFEAIGFYSGFGSASYVPKVNVSALSFTRNASSYPYDASICYGVDAKPGKDWAIMSPESSNYPTYEALISDLASVDSIYRDALDKISERIVNQFKATSPPAPAVGK